ncbi:hypothetical protein ENU1_124310 [Entamoeba nuttalli P19]|uniref:AP-5 complex subunit zeta-1 C-terminal TPR domain-containing protein n=1 Tax=Entamoeba nuttalli (strain P19) TaxID=1076696 RepID=K2GAJ9_ENTNP|nr:hypothetical protein ENU1_124310 [Entamoeba nuttalli P19]EKE39546.1 hypothetical protein ENU1_124310 [Entamoeba nuttalli P19]|eukprot:XP_008858119.1 hypothetical protein ENU1_124310 [Entamoeba nuttalli P19]
MSRQQPLTTEGRFEQLMKMNRSKDKLLEYRRLLPILLNYGTGATPSIIKCLLNELVNEKSPLLLKYIAAESLYTLPEMNLSFSGTTSDIFFIIYNLRKGFPVANHITPTNIISLLATDNKLLNNQLIPVLFAVCCREKISETEIAQVDSTITRYLQMNVTSGTLEFNPNKLSLQIQEQDGKISNTPIFTVMNISSRNLYTTHMSQHHQIVSDLIQYISKVNISVQLCETTISYVNQVMQQFLRIQNIQPVHAVIYHEMVRLLGIIAVRQPSLSHNVSSVLQSIKIQAEHIDPFVALSFLDATLMISSEFVQSNAQKVNSFITEFLVKNNGFSDILLVSETLRIIKKHSIALSTESIFFPFTAIAMHSTSIQRDVLPLLYLFIGNGNASSVLHYILDLPIIALLLTIIPPGTVDYEKKVENYQFAYNYLYRTTYEGNHLWKGEYRSKLEELLRRPERNSGRVKAATKCVPALLRVFFQAVSVRYNSESEALKIVKEIISRYDCLYPDTQFMKGVRETFISALSVMIKAAPCILSVLVAALDGLLKSADFVENSYQTEFANHLCLLVGENAHFIKPAEIEFLLAEVDPQTFEDSNYPEYLQISLLSLYCKLGQAIGQNSKVKLTLCKLIGKIDDYPMLSMRTAELYALFATPGLAEATFRNLQFDYIDVDAPLPALVSTLEASDAHPLHPFTLFVNENESN